MSRATFRLPVTEALNRILTADTPTRMHAACERAATVGATRGEIEHVRSLWTRTRPCDRCGHAISAHAGQNCWQGPCGCAGYVSPDQESAKP